MLGEYGWECTLDVARLLQLLISIWKDPNLPNIMSDHVPASEGSTGSETFAKHLNTLHFARRAVIESESDERILLERMLPKLYLETLKMF